MSLDPEDKTLVVELEYDEHSGLNPVPIESYHPHTGLAPTWGRGNPQFLKDFVANTKNIDVQREQPPFIQFMDDRGTKWMAKIYNWWLVNKSGRPLRQLFHENIGKVVALTLSVMVGASFSIYLYLRHNVTVTNPFDTSHSFFSKW